MTTYAAVAVAVSLVAYLVRAWYRSALAKQSAADAAALANPSSAVAPDAKFGRKFSSPAMGAKYDESKAKAWHRSQVAQAGHARAKSRKAQAAQPSKVEQIASRRRA